MPTSATPPLSARIGENEINISKLAEGANFWYVGQRTRHGSFPLAMIDLHSHGIDGVDTRTEDPARIRRIAEIQGREGVTEMLLSVYSAPIPTMRRHMEAVGQAMELQESAVLDMAAGTSTDSLPGREAPSAPAARILGIHLEGPFLNSHWPGALDPDSFLEPDESRLFRLIEGFEEVVRTVTIAPEMKGAVELVRIMTRMGIAVNMGHSDATWTEAEACFDAGARGITHLFNGMRGFHHREPGIAGFGLLNSETYVEIIGDMMHLSRETLDLVFRLKGPDKVLLVSDSVAMTGISAACEVPRGDDGRLLGGAMSLPRAVRRLAEEGFSRELIGMAVDSNPRAYLHRRPWP
jgi:N-acetylglucosamine-6-phosphate deacetylase